MYQQITPPHQSIEYQPLDNTAGNPSRLREFDAMRGFSMLLVVLIHVMLTSGIGGSTTVFGNFISSFRLPLFFFVSGFFSWRPLDKWNKATTERVTTQKFRAQIICAVLFYALLAFTRSTDPFGWLDKGFGGYWFTGVLFIMYLFYLLSVGLSKILRRDISIVIMSFCAICGLTLIVLHKYPDNRLWTVINGTNICIFLQYYVMGMIYRKYKSLISAFLNNDKIKAGLMIGYVLLFCLEYSNFITERPSLQKILSGIVITYVGVMMVVSLFYGAKEYFQRKGIVSDFLCRIGSRSLDVYMLHYFFLPSLLFLGPYISSGNRVLFQILIPGIIAIAVVGVCLFISNCLRQSEFLAVWLFGVRRRTALK